MEKRVMAFDEAQITSPINGSVPTWGAACYTLATFNAHRMTLIIQYEKSNDDDEEK